MREYNSKYTSMDVEILGLYCMMVCDGGCKNSFILFFHIKKKILAGFTTTTQFGATGQGAFSSVFSPTKRQMMKKINVSPNPKAALSRLPSFKGHINKVYK